MGFNFSPSQKFNDEAKKRYLAVFDARYPAAALGAVPAGRQWLVVTARLLGTALAIVAIVMGSATVYADTANVPATSPLYPFKRLGEDVRLALAPSQADASLEASFAARRVAELKNIQTSNPSSTLIPKLSKDADKAVNASIAAAEKNNLKDGALTGVCTRLLKVLVSSSTTMRGELRGNLDALYNFTSKCENASNGPTSENVRGNEGQVGSGRRNETSTSTASGAVTGPAAATSPATAISPALNEANGNTSTNNSSQSAHPEMGQASATSSGGATTSVASPSVQELEMHIQNYLNEHAQDSSSLDLATSSDNAAQSAIIEIQGRGHGYGGDSHN